MDKHRSRREIFAAALCSLGLAACATTTAPAGYASMRGMYTYMADAGLFTDCASGQRLPVAQEGDNAALEVAYSKARAGAGVPMLVTVEGRIEMRMPMEGPGPRPMLVVERFISVVAGTCKAIR